MSREFAICASVGPPIYISSSPAHKARGANTKGGRSRPSRCHL